MVEISRSLKFTKDVKKDEGTLEFSVNFWKKKIYHLYPRTQRPLAVVKHEDLVFLDQKWDVMKIYNKG